MRRRTMLLTSAIVLLTSACAKRHAQVIRLFLLPDGHVRLENGKELDLAQLREQVRIWKQENPRPEISLEPNKTIAYERVAKIIMIFQEEDYGPHLGFTGMDQPD